MPVFADARDRDAPHVLGFEAQFIQQAEKTRAGRAGLRPRERVHFHQDRPRTPALFGQGGSRTLDNLLLEALDVDFDDIDPPAGKRTVCQKSGEKSSSAKWHSQPLLAVVSDFLVVHDTTWHAVPVPFFYTPEFRRLDLRPRAPPRPVLA